ncbi:MAG: aminopeptidase P family protein [candidate division WOR-3 bacterium]
MKKELFENIVRRIIEEKSVTGILIAKRENVRYITGFTGTMGYIYSDGENTIFLTDFRYVEQAEKECSGYKVERLEKGLVGWLTKRGTKKLGLEDWVTFGFVEELRREGIEVVPIGKPVEFLRAKKDISEIELIKSALKIAEDAFVEVLSYIKDGVSEKDIALELVYRMRQKGAEKEAFEVIVASGERSSLPHGVASNRKLKMGDIVVIDFGANYLGYNSDVTRVVSLGTPREEVLKVYKAIINAMDEVMGSIANGKCAKEIHEVTCSVLDKYGYGKFFGHGTGHGVGLEVHEIPSISLLSKDVIEEGMVFTVEPGVYIPGEFGVRIEDMVYLGNEIEVLNNLKRDIVII